MRNPARERSRNLNREVWESPSVLRRRGCQGLPHIKVIYVNDGPGLLLGSMWNDYAYIEDQWPDRVKVVTLRMVPDRITSEWLRS